MQCALLIYNPDDDVADQAQRPIDPGIAAVLGRPDVTGWIACTHPARLHERLPACRVVILTVLGRPRAAARGP